MTTGKGKVYLIGAGPGDIGLLTVKGMRCLQRADVVVYDFHLNAQILNYINHDAEFIYAGKRGGHHAMTQDQINQAIVDKALEGKMVCRLKGGDPFVFGRGGEEAEVLADKAITFEIVPGVSSSVAAPAYAGIPLTHRKYSSSFAVITGNEDATKPGSTIDWQKLARGLDTLVFLMGVKNMGAITQKLLEHGKPADTPAAVIRWGTRPDQKTVTSTLDGIASLIREENIRPPAVMIIGDVVKLRGVLQWYENKPLFGHRVLITREYTADYEPLEELGAEVFAFPTIRISPPEDWTELDLAIDAIDTYTWLVLTSVNGWKYFLERFLKKNRDIRDLKGVRLCAIGTKTAEAVRQCGLKVDLVPNEFNAEGLVKAFSAQAAALPASGGRETGQPLKGVRILLPRAAKAREVFPEEVRRLGGEIDAPPAYRAVKPEKHGKRLKRFLQEGRITIATFTSAATFTNFLEMMGDEAIRLLQGAEIAVIGPVTARSVEKAGLRVSIMPRVSTIGSMVEAIIQQCGKASTESQ